MRACTPISTYKSNVNITPLKYKLDAEYKDRSNNSSLSVKFGNADNISNYIYSRDENVYIRENSVDRNTSVSVKLKNLIVEEVTVDETYSENRLLSISLTGQGKAVFMFDGKVIEGIWQKDKRESRTKYFDKSGKEVEFNRGKTLISIVNKGSSYEAK
jgi:hypothetical protein